MAIGKHGHVTVPCGFIHANLPTRQCAFGRLHVITIFTLKIYIAQKLRHVAKNLCVAGNKTVVWDVLT